MNVDSLRRYCLSFPNTRETLQWGETLCFKVANKLFATLSLDVASETRLCLKCTPERFAELLEIEGCHPAPYVGRYKWIGMESFDCLNDRELQAAVSESYALISAKLPKKTLSRKPNRRKSRAKPKLPRR